MAVSSCTLAPSATFFTCRRNGNSVGDTGTGGWGHRPHRDGEIPAARGGGTPDPQGPPCHSGWHRAEHRGGPGTQLRRTPQPSLQPQVSASGLGLLGRISPPAPPPSFLPFVAVCAGCWPSRGPDGGFGDVSSSSGRQSPFLCRFPSWMKTSLSDLPQVGPPPVQGQPGPYATTLRLRLTPAQRSPLHPNHTHGTGHPRGGGDRSLPACTAAAPHIAATGHWWRWGHHRGQPWVWGLCPNPPTEQEMPGRGGTRNENK